MQNLIGTKWVVIQPGSSLPDIVFEFCNNGILKDGNRISKWEMKDGKIFISHNNGYATLIGEINNSRFHGTASNIVGKKWTFEGKLLDNNANLPKHAEEIKLVTNQDLSVETTNSSGHTIPTLKEKNGYKYFYYFAYYPKRFTVSEKYKGRRRLIWDFKDGHNSIEIANVFIRGIGFFKLNQPISDWWLCIIPASTKDKTENRFKRFCEVLCNATQLNNGYNLIFLRENRIAKHLQEDRNSVNIMDTLEFGDVHGKKILLFDDLYTTGNSFTKVANKLITFGAKEIVGAFLGKTHWLEDDNDIQITEIIEE